MDQDMAVGRVRTGAQDDTIMKEIMLRFRPIAPKPAAGIPVAEEIRDGLSGSKRRKRRYVRVCGGRKGSGRKDKRKEENNIELQGCRSDKEMAKMLSLLPDVRASDAGRLDLKLVGRPRVEAESWVTVLSVTDDACMDRWVDLEGDTCPGFVSDGEARLVYWSNPAYRRMVAGGLGEEEAAGVTVRVGLRLSDSVALPLLSAAFACMVRVEYTWRNEMASGAGRASVLPCDVWRLTGGGCAWRLDVNARLTLGSAATN